MIEITVNDRLGKKVRVKCNGDDTIGDLKKLIAAQVKRGRNITDTQRLAYYLLLKMAISCPRI